MQFYQLNGFMGVEETPDGEVSKLPAPEDAALLVDFDGTLIEIVDRSEDIVVPGEVKSLLNRAVERLDGRVGIISGRSVETLNHYLPDFEGMLIGTHGTEARLAGQHETLVSFDTETVSRLSRLVDDFCVLRPEFAVEHRPSGVVLSFRHAEEHGALALRFMESLAMAADGFHMQPALMAYELRPDGVGKETGVAHIMSLPDLAGKTPIFAGDDLTDELALGWVQDHGGVAIKIGHAESVARNRLATPSDFRAALSDWLG